VGSEGEGRSNEKGKQVQQGGQVVQRSGGGREGSRHAPRLPAALPHLRARCFRRVGSAAVSSAPQ
jgi:hypothetical protein